MRETYERDAHTGDMILEGLGAGWRRTSRPAPFHTTARIWVLVAEDELEGNVDDREDYQQPQHVLPQPHARRVVVKHIVPSLEGEPIAPEREDGVIEHEGDQVETVGMSELGECAHCFYALSMQAHFY